MDVEYSVAEHPHLGSPCRIFGLLNDRQEYLTQHQTLFQSLLSGHFSTWNEVFQNLVEQPGTDISYP